MIKQRSLAKLIVLSFLTCGIYGFFFWWGYINDINEVCVCDGKRSPNLIVVMLLSFFTCGLYNLFWLHRQGERLQSIAPDYKLRLKQGGSSVLIKYILGSFLMGFASSSGGTASLASGKYTVTFAGYSDVALREMVNAWHIPPDVALIIALYSIVMYLLGIVLMLSSLNILIENLNAVGKVYNAKCS